MKTSLGAGAVLGACLIPTILHADTTSQPPMNSFNFAFYNCADGAAFQISYDSDTPTAATMTTNDNNRQYELKRTADSNGVQFSNGAVKFWTDGKTVVVQGTRAPLKNCRMKGR
jgi:membrane-bound inhibitor of C-type lysozyme